MTRSIHETWRDLEDAGRWDDNDSEAQADRVAIIRDRLARKRRYKSRVAASRAPRGQRESPLALEVVTEPGPPQAHHPLSEEDVRRLIELFPADVRPELARVSFLVGGREQENARNAGEVDPFIGRHGHELPGGIWRPMLSGWFHRDRGALAEIVLCSYVYEQSELRVPEVQTAILWLEQADTLAHEIAHAWDYSARIARDRWGAGETDRHESYAEAMARQWVRSVACAYFIETYPERAAAFDDWVRTHVKIPIPLWRVAEDHRRSSGVDKGLLHVCAAWGEIDELDALVDIADAFVYHRDLAPAKQLLTKVLEAAPTHLRAIVLMGDIARHQRMWPDALRWTAKAVELGPSDVDAHGGRVVALERAKDWMAMVVACDDALRLVTLSDADRRHFQIKRGRALIKLLRLDEATVALLEVVVPAGNRIAGLDEVQIELLLAQKRWRDARELATARLAQRCQSLSEAIFTAAHWETSRQLGIDQPEVVPTDQQIHILGASGCDEWVERLKTMGLKPARRVTRRQADLARRKAIKARL